jgi:hypothetical protein
MSAKQRMRGRLEFARGFSESLLKKFKSPADFTHQVHAHANHALWFAGHIAQTDNFFIAITAPSKAVEKARYSELFGMGSQPTSDPAAYPPVEEVLDYMRERRKTLLDVLDSLSEEDLAKPTPEGTPAFLPDIASVFETAAWHEGMHAGQVTIASRSLGNTSVFSPAVAD